MKRENSQIFYDRSGSMASFQNYATLSYQGGTTNSNTVTGELRASLTLTKQSVLATYAAGDRVTYVLSLVNSGTTALQGLTVTDNLGAYLQGEVTRTPLTYTPDSLRLYLGGVLQAAPAVTAGPPLTVGPFALPAGENALLLYEAAVNEFAPLDADASITNTATVTGDGLAAPLTASATVTPENRARLTISKALCPATVTENGQLTYTFVIANAGSAPATADDAITLRDTFQPILRNLTAALDGETLIVAQGDYTYDETTGIFATLPGRITVPAATYTQAEDGTWVTTPGTAVLTVTGTV